VRLLRGDRGLRAQQLEGREREDEASGRAKSDNRRTWRRMGTGLEAIVGCSKYAAQTGSGSSRR